MTFKETFELLSLGLTLPTLIFSVWVVRIYGVVARETLRGLIEDRSLENFDTKHLLILGITIGFIGGFFDNLYWWFAWLSSFLELTDWQQPLFENGVFANLPFRQGATLMAAILHVIAASKSRVIQMKNNKKIEVPSPGSTMDTLMVAFGAGLLGIAALAGVWAHLISHS